MVEIIMTITDEIETNVHRTIRRLYKEFPNDPAIAFVVKSAIEGLVRAKRIRFITDDIEADDLDGIEADGC